MDRRSDDRLVELSQQARIRVRPEIGQQSRNTIGPDSETRVVRFQKDCFADKRVHWSDPGMSLDEQDPGFLLGMQLPIRTWRQLDPLENEMRAGNEHGSRVGQTARNRLTLCRPRGRRRDGVVQVDFALPAMIEKAKRRVAALLDFSQHESRADGVDRASRDEDDIVLPRRVPLNQVRDRAVLDRGAQLRSRELPFQPDGNFGLGRCGQDVPGLAFAIRQAD
jgi:hypothetical protein